jgi:hypothetical protein
MKLIVRLTSVALLSCSQFSPCFALGHLSSQSYEQEMNKSTSLTPKIIKVAGFGLGDIFRGIDQGLDIVEQEKRRKEDRERRLRIEKEQQELKAAREEQARKMQAEAKAAREAANEKQRLEADRRQKYFESLSPEQKKTYIAEQRAIQQKQNEMAAKLFLIFAESLTRPQVCYSGNWFTGYTYYEC